MEQRVDYIPPCPSCLFSHDIDSQSGELQRTGCIACDPELNQIVESS